MFDSVLSKSGAPQGNIAGLGLTLVVCGAVATAVVFLPSVRHKKASHEVDVTFIASRPPPPPPPPPPPAGATATKTVEKKVTPKKKELVLKPKTEPDPQPTPTPEPEPQQETAQAGGVQGGVPGGVQGGVVGGVQGGVVGGVLGGQRNGALPFGLGMTRPTQIAGEPPQYSREALAARVQGKVLVKCVITVQGAIQDCKVIKGVPMLDQITLESLRKSRFTPVMYQGRPEAVQYLFTFNFKLP
jgi:periplasmic protein TonB